MKLNKRLLKCLCVFLGINNFTTVSISNSYSMSEQKEYIATEEVEIISMDGSVDYKSDKDKEVEILKEIELLKDNYTEENINHIELLIESISEENLKTSLTNLLDDAISKSVLSNMTANIDVYIQSENVLTMSLDTNYILFDNFDGVNDMEKLRAINIAVNSTLPYELSTTLVTEIANKDGSKIMDKQILNIKEEVSSEYKTFLAVGEKIILSDNNPPATDMVHYIDLMLKGGISYSIDVYKAVLKFEVQQK